MTIPDPSNENRAGYDRWAAIYDSYANSTVAIDDMTFPALYAHLKDKRVLEIGCGTGRHTIRLARDNDVTGIDLSPGMLDVARQKLSGCKAQLIEADIMAGPLNLGLFDAVVTALVLEHIGDLATFFRRAGEALADSSELLLSEIHPDRIAKGTQANFTDPGTGETVRLKSFAHSEADIQSAARDADLRLLSHMDVFGGNALVRRNSAWEKHLGKPLIRIWTFEKA
ncbi:class I SAM-dependent DNA methyltransferase [Asticcacaulis solisilvae]|uniref:class I SAM-dependent DNA methyltransferase n=1 Tax=Asticcacaulis solisilvae TaxID=1217274 RepID=UPI003FD866C0